MRFLNVFLTVGVLFLLTALTLNPLFMRGVFPIHDDTQVARVYEMAKALSDGHFPVRWVADLGYGYGYPLFNFYAPLAYYTGAFFNLIGFPTLVATKIIMGIGIGLSALTMYLFAKTLWGRGGGMIASALYLYAPYHAVNAYVRGDVAEYFAYALYPLVFLGFYKVATQSRSSVWLAVASVSFAGVILSHNLSAFMITPFLLFYLLFLLAQGERTDRIEKAKRLFAPFLIGILVAGFYWIPVLFEMKYTNVFSQVGGGADFRDHFVCFTQLWQSQWGFGGSVPGCIDGLSFMLGKILIVLGIASVLLFILWGKRETIIDHHAPFFLFGVVLAVFLMLPVSQSVWEIIPMMEFLQYPWRFLGVAVFFLSLLGGGINIFLQKREVYAKVGIVGALLIIIVFTNREFFAPQTIHTKTNDALTSDHALKWTTSKISDEYMPPNFQKPLFEGEIVTEKIVVTENDGTVEVLKNETDELHAEITVSNPTLVKINTAYFPAWRLWVDGKESHYLTRADGIYVQIPAGSHKISLRYVQTPIEKIGNSVSAVGILLVGVGIMHMRKKHINGT